jgi:transcriptional regulator with XRE-family HTH domain
MIHNHGKGMYEILIKNIKNYLARTGLTTKELERRANIKPSTLQNVLAGRSKNPGLDTLLSVAKELGCLLDDLVNTEDCFAIPHMELFKTRLSKIKWDPALMIETIAFVQAFLQENNSHIDSGNVIACILELYIYSSSEGSSTFDKKFAAWYVEKTFTPI